MAKPFEIKAPVEFKVSKVEVPILDHPAPKTENEKILDEKIPNPEPEYHRILREHNYTESNIPCNSPYWKLRP